MHAPGSDPNLLRAQFKAMASPCEALIDTREAAVAQRVATAVSNEAFRIEQKFSRYRADNVVHAINNANGAAVEVDAETADLLDYAQHCFETSGGLFDVTSGVLRRVWKFDGSDRLPSPPVARARRQAGLLSTLAILQGAGAERFLKAHKVAHWVIR